jgi:hypothetical protein
LPTIAAPERLPFLPGHRDDGLHNAMLDNNPEADIVFQEGAVQAAIKGGVPEARARRIYGVPARKK